MIAVPIVVAIMITVVVAIVVAIVVPIVVPIMITVMVMIMLISMFALMLEVALALFVVVMLPLAPMRRVHVGIPTIGDEVDRPIAGVIFLAMSRPVPFMSGRDVQIQRLGGRYAHDHGSGHHNRRAWQDQLGRGYAAANGNLSVDAGHVDIHSNTYVAGQRRGG